MPAAILLPMFGVQLDDFLAPLQALNAEQAGAVRGGNGAMKTIKAAQTDYTAALLLPNIATRPREA